MVEKISKNHPHFILQNGARKEAFSTPPRGGSNQSTIQQDRYKHGGFLLKQVQQLSDTLTTAVKQQKNAGVVEGYGLQVEFESFPGIELAIESLDRNKSGIELRNVRYDDNHTTFATVFVPEGQLAVFEKLINDYLNPEKDTKNGQPANNKLFNAIATIRTAALEALWTDAPETLPTADHATLWWEVWLPTQNHRQRVINQFKRLALKLEFRIAPGELHFPERSVLLMHGSVSQMKRSIMMLNSIAELRRAKETADFFVSLPFNEQPEWADELKARLSLPKPDDDVPYVCLLDTGINTAHPLLKHAVATADRHSVEPGWGMDDAQGHGTGMAGLALYGNLTDALSSQLFITVGHRIESVKLIQNSSTNHGDPQLHGHLTTEAVNRPIVTAPHRQRVYCMTITAEDNHDRGRPSAWSAAIDRLAYGNKEHNEAPKLFILSAGNLHSPHSWVNYPDSNTVDSIQDPAQAWNALTVGAMTHLSRITETDADAYTPIAEAGGLSPFSTTSQSWQTHWPLKPDVVFEGGNAAKDHYGAVWMPSLSLLTTHSKHTQQLFTTTNATSAAAALCARMAAQLMALYPALRPESIRGLIVHSAQWTDTMKRMFLPNTGQASKAQMMALVRHCGFGEPSLDRAKWSVNNSLTLLSEDYLRPFQLKRVGDVRLYEMNLHQLPWPLKELEALGQTKIEMRVTLSYFIEPSPSARGVTSRYRYESHGLRFDVKRPFETTEQFRHRINAAARDGKTYASTGDSDTGWVIGIQGRHRGSLHSDIWVGSAADLASRGVIAVYPSSGWWQKRPILKRYNQRVKYSLLVSIHAPNLDVDLYTPIANQINVPILT